MGQEEITGRKYNVKCGEGTLIAYVVDVGNKPDFGIFGYLSEKERVTISLAYRDTKDKIHRSINSTMTYGWLDIAEHRSEFRKRDLIFLLGKVNVEAMEE